MGKYSDNVIADYLINNATCCPDHVVVSYGDTRRTWRQINDRVNSLAQGLLRMGIGRNEKVILMFYNRPEFLEANWAVQKVGAIPVPMNYRFTAREIAHQVADANAVLFIFEQRLLPAVQAALPDLTGIRRFICLGDQTPDDIDSFEAIIQTHPPVEPHIPTSPEDTCVMIYTGGTTGLPKGVMLSYGAHRDMFAAYFARTFSSLLATRLNAEQRDKAASLSPLPGAGPVFRLMQTVPFRKLLGSALMERFFRWRLVRTLERPYLFTRIFRKEILWMFPTLPFFHAASYQMTLLFAMLARNSMDLSPEAGFNPHDVLARAHRIRPMVMANVPTGWKKLMDCPEIDQFDLSSIMLGVTGAGVAPVALKKKILQKMPGLILMDAFGQTEMTPITSLRIDTAIDGLAERSVGRPIVETRIIDEDGKDVLPGEIGEIIYRGPTMMQGYYNDSLKTRGALIDGWFRSGDLGYFDENGEIRVAERKNECISSGGEKIFPGEVEEVLAEHPKVGDVCVIGVPDETWGQSVRAVILLKPGQEAMPEEILDFCRDRLAGYKRPRSVVFVDDFPMSPVGKVLRQKIREKYGK